MTQFRYIPLALALAAAGALSACATSPMTPMNKPVAGGMAAAHPMARMDEQMKTMLTMHDRMMKAKTPEERSRMMAKHMEMMQAMMGMMHEHMMASMPPR